MVWRRRKVERVRLDIIADRNFEIYGPQLFSGVLWFGIQNLRSANIEIAVRNWSLEFGDEKCKSCGPQIWGFAVRKGCFF
jgi:hypothetical protein